ncbi:hypothetical protein L798_03196 [Zootermopsis nevadensis]|uniref:Uncharacterized protein n=1 Tax=Zootermopsis nevadensis TaxID=136037 RepID=A0A067RMM5_ZOONE|nr:hypothetical protein L798_03196 [Zootermopsis nevadensis]
MDIKCLFLLLVSAIIFISTGVNASADPEPYLPILPWYPHYPNPWPLRGNPGRRPCLSTSTTVTSTEPITTTTITSAVTG